MNKYQQIPFSLYLLNADVHDPDRALRAEYLPRNCAEVQRLAVHPGGNARAYLRMVDAKPPLWATALGGQIDGLSTLVRPRDASSDVGAEPEARITGMVVVAPAADRMIAFAFGYGRHMLDPDRYEWGFGLRVGARTFDRNGIRQGETRSLDASGPLRTTTFPSRQRIGAFGLDFDGDWICRLTGRTTPDGDGGRGETVTAADSYRFMHSANLESACRKAASLLETLRQPIDPDDPLSFVEDLTPLKPRSQELAERDAHLAALLRERTYHTTALAPVEHLDFDTIDRFELVAGRDRLPLPDFTLDDLLDTLASASRHRFTPASLGRLRIAAVPANDSDPVEHPLRRWLVHEERQGDNSYLLTLGRWFRVRNERVMRIDSAVRRIPDITAELAGYGMPTWRSDWSEGMYNKKAAGKIRGAACLDTKLGKSLLARTPVEICDILLPDGSFVHVKRGNSSQSLSHLFAQGSASAMLMVDEDPKFVAEYQRYVAADEHAHPALVELRRPSRVIYAIGTPSPEPVPDMLFSIAKVALLSHFRTINRTGIPVAVATIGQECRRR